MSLEINNIDHIGIAVKSLEKSIPLFQLILGTKCYKIEIILDQDVRTAFFKLGDIKIELLESISNDGPISKYIEKNGEGLHHIALGVNNTNESLLMAKSFGFRVIDNIARKGADGMNIGFLNPRSTNNILIEFCSSNN
jgi:methylmalonyl-CoA/ethylmalonyl-CoA epimerase